MTADHDQDGRFTVYLLHFQQLVNGHRHYIGITTYERLGARMIEHTTGRGAKLTQEACRRGTAWRLAAYWRTDRRDLERRLDTLKDAPPACPVCRKLSSGVGYSPTKKRPALEAGRFSVFTLSQATMFPNEPATAPLPEQENAT